jgi:hypothetical protein
MQLNAYVLLFQGLDLKFQGATVSFVGAWMKPITMYLVGDSPWMQLPSMFLDPQKNVLLGQGISSSMAKNNVSMCPTTFWPILSSK